MATAAVEIAAKLAAAVLVGVGWIVAGRQPVSVASVYGQVGLALTVIAGMLLLSALATWIQGKPTFSF